MMFNTSWSSNPRLGWSTVFGGEGMLVAYECLYQLLKNAAQKMKVNRPKTKTSVFCTVDF